MSTTFWSAIIPSNYSGERELKVRLSDRPLQLRAVSVERPMSGFNPGGVSKGAKDEHTLYFASKFHRGGIQLCRFTSETTQQLDIVFEAGDVLHFKVFGDTQAPMYLVGNLLSPVSRKSIKQTASKHNRQSVIVTDPVVIEI